METLDKREIDRVLHKTLCCRQIDNLEPGANAQKCENRQPSSVFRRAARRQRVVGPSAIVAKHLRRVIADKQRPIVIELVAHNLGIRKQHLQMLWRKNIADPHPVVEIAHGNIEAVLDRHTRNLGRRQIRKLLLELRIHPHRKRLARRHKNRKRLRVVLGLRKHVRRNNRRIGCLVCKHKHLRRPREHVDRHATRDNALSRSDPLVARTHHRIACRHGASTIGQRRNCLRSTGRKEPIRTSNICSTQRHRLRPRRGHPHLRHTRGARGHCGHQNRRRQRISSAGRIASRTVDAFVVLARMAARHGNLNSAQGAQLGFCKHMDAIRGALEQALLRRAQQIKCNLEIIARVDQLVVGCCDVPQTQRLVHQPFPSAVPHLIHNLARKIARLAIHSLAAQLLHLAGRLAVDQLGLAPASGRRHRVAARRRMQHIAAAARIARRVRPRVPVVFAILLLLLLRVMRVVVSMLHSLAAIATSSSCCCTA
eukprot:comp21593_c0_seq1/m.47519 comp21593_c0_seq1/g.47519  ORF comp21593_c0_seq1/g.47519 comp21593_c0_seq1/m.47519 type:complete len:482 (+) comp21593_c0_seq1:164-1609(+)